MSWTATQKKWADEMLRSYYGGMISVGSVTAQDVDTLVYGDLEADRIAVATAYAQTVIKPRLEASLNALDDQAAVVETEIAEIPAV